MNYKKIMTLVGHQFKWEKNLFYVTVCATLIAKIIILNFNLHPFFEMFGIILTIIPALYFMRPEFSGNDRSFSAKYLISFPISRREIIFGTTLIYLLMAIPFVVWLLCFNSYLTPIIPFFRNNTYAAFNVLCFAVFAGSISLNSLLYKARGVQWKPKFGELAFGMASFISIFVFIPIVAVAISELVERQLGWAFNKYLSQLFNSIPLIIESPWLGLIILIYSSLIFLDSQQTAIKEIKSYKVPWSLKKDLMQIGGFGFASVICLIFLFTAVPKIFVGKLQTAVYNHDYKKIETLLISGIDINKPNKFGVTPMMVAIRKGDLKLVQFLESKGANYSGEVNKADNFYYGYDARMMAVSSGNLEILNYIKDKVPSFNRINKVSTFYPIHAAALTCNAKVVDFLISNGVNVEIKNNKGLTPLVLAARQNCFESVVSLKEAGAHFDVVEPSGKLALQDLGKNASPELKLFVEKNMRAPASK